MKIRSPKSEVRRKSEARNPKGFWLGEPRSARLRAAQQWPPLRAPRGPGLFGFRISDFLRISDFGFRISAAVFLAAAFCLAAAADTNAPAAPANAPKLLVDDTLTGEVVRVNTKARFVVLSFPVPRMPEIGQRFSVWRTNGVVGELRISGPQRDETTVADIVTGECQRGDEARERKAKPQPAAK